MRQPVTPRRQPRPAASSRAHVWAQLAGIVVTSHGWVTPGVWRCTQYLFRFDWMQVFRDWTARRCYIGQMGNQVLTGGAGVDAAAA
ncbi:MAG TPA: hypothetical protein VGC99_15580 [Candidatus Tectomicrobia bacterium]